MFNLLPGVFGVLVDGCVCMQNGNPQNPYCAGIAGIMDAYHRTLQAVQLYGPTNFSPVINHVARHVSHHAGCQLLTALCVDFKIKFAHFSNKCR